MRGLTVSSVTFVSWRPPVALLCIQHQSSVLDLLEAQNTFAVNILAAEQEGIARRFADPKRPNGRNQFEGITWTLAGEDRVPVISGAICRLECAKLSIVAVGDHKIIFAAPRSVRVRSGRPLLYFTGSLHPGGIAD